MMHQEDASIERLYLRLTDALQRSRRDPYDAPVTVAEIYQELIPYRLVRGDAGFDMNADYEHALLRMLAGEGELVRIEPAHAAEEMQRELRTANPNLSVYRAYAACEAWVRRPANNAMSNAATIDDTAASSAAEPALEPEDVEEAAVAKRFALADDDAQHTSTATHATEEDVRRDVIADSPPPVESARVAAEAPPRSAEQTQPETARCAYCDSALPPQRAARFCPYCGADQSTRPCKSCGEKIEPGWVFCIACGAAAQ